MKGKENLRYAIGSFIGELCLGAGSVILFSYISYCYTDLGHVSAEMTSLAMTICSVLGFVWSLFSGALIQNTRTKRGMYRPWMLFGSIGMAASAFLLLFNKGSMLLNCIVISIGYFLGNSILDLWVVSKYGIYEKISAGKSSMRDLLGGVSYAGGNFGYILYGAGFLTLTGILGGDDMGKGFLYTQCILAVLTVVGAIILCRMAKPFDTDNRKESVEADTRVSLKDMFSSILHNKYLLVLSIGSVLKSAGGFLFTFLVIYQCTAVLEDLMAYSTLLAVQAVAGVVGSFLAPVLGKLLGGRKKIALASAFATTVCFVALALWGDSYIPLMVIVAIETIVQFAYDSVDMMLYLDTAEVQYNRTGVDTRAFTMNIQNLVSKIATTLSTILLGVVLGMIHYEEGMVLDLAGKKVFTMATGLIPAAGFLIFGLLILFFFNLTDKEIQKCIEENAEKDGIAGGEWQ